MTYDHTKPCPECGAQEYVSELKPCEQNIGFHVICENTNRLNHMVVAASHLESVWLLYFKLGNCEQNPFGPLPAAILNTAEFHGIYTPRPGYYVTLTFKTLMVQSLSVTAHFGLHYESGPHKLRRR